MPSPNPDAASQKVLRNLLADLNTALGWAASAASCFTPFAVIRVVQDGNEELSARQERAELNSYRREFPDRLPF
jgi:hypothetical protein